MMTRYILWNLKTNVRFGTARFFTHAAASAACEQLNRAYGRMEPLYSVHQIQIGKMTNV